MDETQSRFKVTTTFDPSYGGGYNITVEDLNTGICETTWAFDKASVKAAAERVTTRMSASNEGPETFYLGEAETPAEDAGETPEVEASE